MKNKITLLVCSFCFLFFFISCSKDELYENIDYPYKVLIHRETREVVLVQDRDNESFGLFYFNVLKENENLWHMWYSSRSNDNTGDWDYDFCYAYSTDGKTWNKRNPKLANNNILIDGNATPATPWGNAWLEAGVFVDRNDIEVPYRVIFSFKNWTGKASVFMAKSVDGLTWIGVKRILETSHDSQFDPIVLENGNYLIFLRMWENGHRKIAYMIVQPDGVVLEQPQIISISGLYNSASTLLDSNTLIMFPTEYDQGSDKMKIKVAFCLSLNIHLTRQDITDDLFHNENIKWGVVSPGLISTGEKDTYWMYYYGSTKTHDSTPLTHIKSNFKYYRIKVSVTPKEILYN